MMSLIRIGIIERPPIQGQPKENLAGIRKCLREMASSRVDLALLPELWATGIIEHMSQEILSGIPNLLNELEQIASKGPPVIIGTLPEAANNGNAYNTTFVTTASGSKPVYRKIHLFPPMDEDKVYTPGEQALVNTLDIGSSLMRTGFLTCFDLRFPELARHLVYNGAQLLLVCALWPESRKEHLKTLVRARAVENQVFVALSNPKGSSGGLSLAGCSGLTDPLGNTVSPSAEGSMWQAFDLNPSTLTRARSRFNSITPPGPWNYRSGTKLLQRRELAEILSIRKKLNHRIVFTNGCFDLLHPGHVEYLEAARGMGDLLVVGLNSDRSVREIKGNSRPINDQQRRAKVLEGLWAVDYVVIFDDPTPINLIREILPDILVKGEDWQEDQIVGADLVKKAGGEVKRIPFRHPTSTSKLIEQILSLHK